MVNAGRVACIFTPFVLTLAALACLILIFIAGTVNKNATLDTLWFAKLDLTNFTSAASANLAGSSSADMSLLTGALEAAKQELNMYDYYTIYLQGYCGWNGNDQYANCSHPKAAFWFDPVSIWGLNSNTTGNTVESILPKTLKDGLNTYEAVSKVMSIVYIIALASTAATALVGISAIFSRIGSLCTTIFAAVAGFFFLAGSIIATVVFITLKDLLNRELKADYGIVTSVKKNTFILTWVGTAFAVGSTFFWLFSVCCCSGRSPYNSGKNGPRKTRAEKTPYTYERVGSPYLGPQGDQAVPLMNLHQREPVPQGYNPGPAPPRDAAYEPFRAQPM